MKAEIELPADLVEAVARRAAELVRADIPAAAPLSPYLTVKEAAAYLRCGRQRIYDLCSAGELSRFKDGERLLIDREELETHVGAVAQLLPRGVGKRTASGVRA
jgi:excisionase family DNA binding protein